MEDFWRQQSEWSQKTFGKDSERGPKGPLKHLEKEVKEALEAYEDWASEIDYMEAPAVRDKFRMEIVDCLFLVFDAARRSGMDYQDLRRRAFNKLQINKERTWPKIGASDDFVEHDKSKGLVIDHELKSWEGLFEPILNGQKTHDFRVMDRDYRVGQVCRLREWKPIEKEYTGRYVDVEITYITSSKHQECAFSPYALHPATAILSIRKIS